MTGTEGLLLDTPTRLSHSHHLAQSPPSHARLLTLALSPNRLSSLYRLLPAACPSSGHNRGCNERHAVMHFSSCADDTRVPKSDDIERTRGAPSTPPATPTTGAATTRSPGLLHTIRSSHNTTVQQTGHQSSTQPPGSRHEQAIPASTPPSPHTKPA